MSIDQAYGVTVCPVNPELSIRITLADDAVFTEALTGVVTMVLDPAGLVVKNPVICCVVVLLGALQIFAFIEYGPPFGVPLVSVREVPPLTTPPETVPPKFSFSVSDPLVDASMP